MIASLLVLLNDVELVDCYAEFLQTTRLYFAL